MVCLIGAGGLCSSIGSDCKYPGPSLCLSILLEPWRSGSELPLILLSLPFPHWRTGPVFACSTLAKSRGWSSRLEQASHIVCYSLWSPERFAEVVVGLEGSWWKGLLEDCGLTEVSAYGGEWDISNLISFGGGKRGLLAFCGVIGRSITIESIGITETCPDVFSSLGNIALALLLVKC